MNFSKKLLRWYDENKRDLPWRKTKNPYKIWLSEIMMQQTRVDQGMSYYLKFERKYPTVEQLANASETDVLKDWQGLGYYSRARNLHYTAKTIVNEFDGVFPSDYKEILSLKGIGKYSAAAISSFAYNQPYAVVDGNVYRFLSRLHGVLTPIDSTEGQKYFAQLAQELIDKELPGNYNQAIMEYGAMVCTPKKPLCEDCVFQKNCEAYNKNMVQDLPIKSKKIKQKSRYFHYLIISNEHDILINKRTGNGIWKNLYDFPLIENEKKVSKEDIIASSTWKSLFQKHSPIVQKISQPVTHQLTHQKIIAQFWEIKIDDDLKSVFQDFTTIKKNEIHNFPVPKLIENYLNSKN